MNRTLVLFFMLAVAGCAYTISDIRLNYQYTPGGVPRMSSRVAVELGEFVDARSVEDKRIIFQKYNKYGKTRGAYRAEEPLADIVRQAVTDGLRAAGVQAGSAPGTLRLEGVLLEHAYGINMGFGSGDVTNHVRFKFRLVDTATNTLVWQDVLHGKVTRMAAWESENFVLSLVKESIDDLVKTLLNDKYFRKKLENE